MTLAPLPPRESLVVCFAHVAYQLKQHHKTRNTPIIILTSMDVDEDTKEQMHGFISTIMSKSKFTKKDLLREISSIEKMR